MRWPPFFLRANSSSAPAIPPATLTPPAEAASNVDADLLRATVDIDAGLPVVSPGALVAFFADDLVETRISLGIGPKLFDEVCVPVVHSLAEWVQTVPATRSAEFRRPLGAYRRALLVGRACAREGLPVIFNAEDSQTERRLLQSHWRVACWLAGTLGELGFLIDQLTVVDENGHSWSPGVLSLSAWAASRNCKRIWLRWSETQGHERQRGSANAYLASRVLPPAVFDYLHSGSGEIARVFLDSISGTVGDAGRTLFNTVQGARARTVSADRAADPIHYGRPVLGVVVAEFIVVAMRDCIESGSWTVNDRRGTVFHTTHGVFLKWPYAAKGIRVALSQQNVAPVPVEPAVLLDTLSKAGLLETQPGMALVSDLWRLTVCGQKIDAIKLRDVRTLVPDGEPWPAIPCEVELGRIAARGRDHDTPPDATHGAQDGGLGHGEDPKGRGMKKRPSRDHAGTPAEEGTPPPKQVPAGQPNDVACQREDSHKPRQHAADIEAAIAALTSRERVILNRVKMLPRPTDRRYTSAVLAASGLTVGVVNAVLEKLGAVEALDDDGLVLSEQHARVLAEE